MFSSFWNFTGLSAPLLLSTCQISECYDHFYDQSLGFKTVRDLTIRHITVLLLNEYGGPGVMLWHDGQIRVVIEEGPWIRPAHPLLP